MEKQAKAEITPHPPPPKKERAETIKIYEKRQKSLFLLCPGGCSPKRGWVDLYSDTENRETDSFSDIFSKGGVEINQRA